MMRRYAVEASGAFFLMFAIAFCGHPLAIGLIFMAMVFIGSHISGAHFNPAVSLAMWVRGSLSTKDLPYYMIAQTVGATLAAALFYGMSGTPFAWDIPAAANLFVMCIPELLLTSLFCLVILVVSTAREFQSIKYFGYVQGLTLVGLAAFGSGFFNPAVALGALIVRGAVTMCFMPLWKLAVIYVVTPLVAGAAAAYKFKFYYPNQ
ncbi:MAG: aquaporin [Candidatus Babeliales bacterium]